MSIIATRLAVMRSTLLVLASLALPATAAVAQDDGQGPVPEVAPQTLRVFTAFQHVFKRVLTEDAAVVLTPGPIGPDGFSEYLNLPSAGPGNGAVGLVVGPGSLLNVRFSAESQCALGGTDFGWCGVRILIDGVEAQPAPADFAFDSTNNGAEGTGSWEGHAMERHLCLRNPSGTPRTVPVQVQWRVFAGLDPLTVPQFRLDDWSLAIETAIATCQ
jgi:hypothetical protein